MMSTGLEAVQLWASVDSWAEAGLSRDDGVLDEVLRRCAAAGLPDIAVSPLQGRLLRTLTAALGARRVLEIGTLGGYSTLHLARGTAAGGHVVTLEINADYAAVARANFAAAGLADRIDLREGPALDLLAELAGSDAQPFDLVFIDADKPSNVPYFDWALRLTRPGGLIIVDNVVRAGAVLDQQGDANVQGVRRLLGRVADEPRVMATLIQTVGRKGHDGLLLAVVSAEIGE